MKLIFMLAFIGLVAGARFPKRSMSSGETSSLVYEYNTQFATGVEESSDVYSIMRLQAKVLMTPERSASGEQVWKIQFKDLNLRQRNNETESLPSQMIPMEKFQNLKVSDAWFQIEKELKRPFSARMSSTSQLVTKVSFPETEAFWSINIKKAFLAFLQINFRQEHTSEAEYSQNKWTKETDEMTTAAECKVTYNVDKLDFTETESDAAIYKVHKSIDFNNCLNPMDRTRGLPGLWTGLQHTESFTENRLKNLIDTNHMARYTVISNSKTSSPIIEKSTARTVYTSSPFRESSHGSIRSYALQSLILLDKDEVEGRFSTEISDDESKREHTEGVRLTFPEEAVVLNKDAMRQQVIRLLQQLATQSTNATIQQEIVRILKHHLDTVEDLEKISLELLKLRSSMDQSECRKMITRFILDICPQLATHEATRFLIKIVNQVLREESTSQYVEFCQMTIWDIPAIFVRMSTMGKIQLRTLRAVFDLVRSEEFKNKLRTPERMPIYSSAWLSVGAMMNVFFAKQGGQDPYMIPIGKDSDYLRKLQYQPWELRKESALNVEEIRKSFVEEVQEGLRQQDDRRTLALKVAKNSGLFELFDDIKTIMNDRRASIVDRVHAVYATKKMLERSTLPKLSSEEIGSVVNEHKYVRPRSVFESQLKKIQGKIQAELLRCFRNVREDPELRIACYRVLVQSPIKQSVLNMIVQYAMSEPTQQVYTYVMRHMMQMVESEIPRYEKTARVVRPVLSMIKRRYPETLSYSRVWMQKLWSQLHEMGISLETDLIMSDKSFTPRWAHIRLDHETLGRQIPLLEISIRTEGLQNLLQRWIGPNGLIYTYAKMFQTQKSSKTAVSDSDILDILPRILKEVPNMEMCVSIFGYQVIDMQASPRLLSDIKKGRQSVIDRFVSSSKRISMESFFTIHNHFELPTTTGNMLEWDQVISLKKHTSHFQLKPQINLSEKQGDVLISAALPLTLSVADRFGCNIHALEHYVALESVVELFKGQRFTAKVNIDLQDETKPEMSIKVLTPNTTEPLMRFKSQINSIAAEYLTTVRAIQRVALVTPLKHRQSAKQMETKYRPQINTITKFLGFTVELKRKYFPSAMIYNAPCMSLLGGQQMELQVVPLSEEYDRRHYVQVDLKAENTEAEKSLYVKMDLKSTSDANQLTEGSLVEKLVHLTLKTSKDSHQKYTIKSVLSWFLDMPETIHAEATVELPEDLNMGPRSLPLNPEEWIQTGRALVVKMTVSNPSQTVATVTIRSQVNTDIVRLLKEQIRTQKEFVNAFPRLRKCLNETRKSNTEEPLSANPLFTPSCVRQYKRLNALSELDIEIKKVAPWFLSCENGTLLQSAVVAAKNILRQYLTSESWLEKSSHDAVRMNFRVSPFDSRVLRIEYNGLKSKRVYSSIRLPVKPFLWTGVTSYLMQLKDFVQGGASKCQLLHSHIRTFDDVVYTIPQTLLKKLSQNKCPVLLAKDCSTEKRFEVTSQVDQTSENKKSIIIRINTGDKQMEVKVSKKLETSNPEAQVEVNGQQIVIPAERQSRKEEIQIFQRQIQTSKGPLTLTIYRYFYSNTFMYRIRCLEHQFQVLVGGDKLRSVQIRVSPFYHNKMCGLCGDYNSEKFQEFKAPNFNRVLPHSQQMVQEYTLPLTEACQAIKEDTRLVPELEAETSSYKKDQLWMSKRSSKCKISKDNRIRTFNHARTEMLSPALRQMLENTLCSLKLAAAEINGNTIRVYKRQNEILIRKEDGEKMEIKLSTVPPTVIRTDSAPRGLKIEMKSLNDGSLLCSIKNEENFSEHLTIVIKRDGRVSISSSERSSEDCVCEIRHPSDIELTSSSLYNFIQRYTDNSKSCSTSLKRSVHKCHVSPKSVSPFYKSTNDYYKSEHKFLTEETLDKLAEKEVPVLLSVDQIDEDKSDLHSVHLIHQKKSEQLVRQVIIKKNNGLLFRATIPKSGPIVLEYSNGESLEKKIYTTPITQSSEKLQMDSELEIVRDNDKLVVRHPRKMYEVEIDMSTDLPSVNVVRAYPHPKFQWVGLCQINQKSSYSNWNPVTVLKKVLTQSVNDIPQVFTESETSSIRQLVSELQKDVLDKEDSTYDY